MCLQLEKRIWQCSFFSLPVRNRLVRRNRRSCIRYCYTSSVWELSLRSLRAEAESVIINSYSQTWVQRPPSWSQNCGRCSEVSLCSKCRKWNAKIVVVVDKWSLARAWMNSDPFQSNSCFWKKCNNSRFHIYLALNPQKIPLFVITD